MMTTRRSPFLIFALLLVAFAANANIGSFQRKSISDSGRKSTVAKGGKLKKGKMSKATKKVSTAANQEDPCLDENPKYLKRDDPCLINRNNKVADTQSSLKGSKGSRFNRLGVGSSLGGTSRQSLSRSGQSGAQVTGSGETKPTSHRNSSASPKAVAMRTDSESGSGNQGASNSRKAIDYDRGPFEMVSEKKSESLKAMARDHLNQSVDKSDASGVGAQFGTHKVVLTGTQDPLTWAGGVLHSNQAECPFKNRAGKNDKTVEQIAAQHVVPTNDKDGAL